MSAPADPLRVCEKGCLFAAKHEFCAWHGSPLAELVGLRLGQFRIERTLSAEGGFGVVYYARNINQPEIEAAVKVLRPPYCYATDMVRIFLYESGLGRGLEVTQIAKITDVAREPWPHITMAFIDGHTLQDEFNKYKKGLATSGHAEWIPLDDAKGMMEGIASALQAAHARDLHHRDLKPLNIMLTSDRSGPSHNWVKVIDWGIAMKLDEATAKGDGSKSASETTEMMHEKLSRMGSLPYMAPEHFEKTTDTRSDVYQFGLIAYELLTGKKPYVEPENRTDPVQWQNVHKFQIPKDIRKQRKGIDRYLANIIHRCLDKDPKKRFKDGAQLYQELRRSRIGPKTIGLVATLALAVIVVAFIKLSGDPNTITNFWGANVELPTMKHSEAVTLEGEERPPIFWVKKDALQNLGAVKLPSKNLSGLNLIALSNDGASSTAEDSWPGLVYFDNEVGLARFDFKGLGERLEKLREDGGGDSFAFAVTGTITDPEEVDFRQRFFVEFDELPPEIIKVRLQTDWDGTEQAVDLYESATGEDPRPSKIYYPAGARATIKLLVTVKEENHNSDASYSPKEKRPGAYLRVSGTDINVAHDSHVEGDVIVYELVVPIASYASTSGSVHRFDLGVCDLAQNLTSMQLNLVFDSGANFRVSSQGLVKEKNGGAHIDLVWKESQPLRKEMVSLRMNQSDEVDVLGVEPLPNGSQRVTFSLLPSQIERLTKDGEWKLGITVNEGYLNAPSIAKALPPVIVKADKSIDLAGLADAGRLELHWDGVREPRPLRYLKYPEFDSPESFAFETTEVPQKVVFFMTNTDARDLGFSIDWDEAIEANAQYGLKAYSDGLVKRGVEFPVGELDGESPKTFQLTFRTSWSREKVTFPVQIRHKNLLPDFFSMRQLQTTEDSSDVREGRTLNVTKDTGVKLEVRWKPTYGDLKMDVKRVSGDHPATASWTVTKAVAEKTSWNVQHPLLNVAKKNLREGQYKLKFRLRDIFGNERSQDDCTVLVRILGEAPRITPRCNLEDCVVDREDGCQLRIGLVDETGVEKISISVSTTGEKDDLKKLFEGTLDELTPSKLAALLANDLEIQDIDNLEDGATDFTVVYSGLQIEQEHLISITAWDSLEVDQKQRAQLLEFKASCKLGELPDNVPFLGMNWIKAQPADDETFYFCEYELSRGFKADVHFHESAKKGDEGLRPLTDSEAEAMHDWALENKFDFPTIDQWRYVMSGGGSQNWVSLGATLSNERDPQYKRLIKALICIDNEGKNREQVPVNQIPESMRALAKEKANEGLFLGAHHVFGNVSETVLQSRSGKRIFKHIGGHAHARMKDCTELGDAFFHTTDVGFRLIVHPDKNPDFQAALRAAALTGQ